jgi:hypothetical protein
MLAQPFSSVPSILPARARRASITHPVRRWSLASNPTPISVSLTGECDRVESLVAFSVLPKSLELIEIAAYS